MKCRVCVSLQNICRLRFTLMSVASSLTPLCKDDLLQASCSEWRDRKAKAHVRTDTHKHKHKAKRKHKQRSKHKHDHKHNTHTQRTSEHRRHLTNTPSQAFALAHATTKSQAHTWAKPGMPSVLPTYTGGVGSSAWRTLFVFCVSSESSRAP